jgi:hypothetical protein
VERELFHKVVLNTLVASWSVKTGWFVLNSLASSLERFSAPDLTAYSPEYIAE